MHAGWGARGAFAVSVLVGAAAATGPRSGGAGEPTWSEVPSAIVAPAPRQGAVLAYDPALKAVVMAGGFKLEVSLVSPGTREINYRDTWVWAGRWVRSGARLAASYVPGLSAGCYDPGLKAVVLVGGTIQRGAPGPALMYLWSGRTWQLYRPGPPFKIGGNGVSLTWDARQHELLALVAGDGVWSFGAKGWSRLPSGPDEGDLVFDPLSGVVTDFDFLSGRAWSWKGQRWQGTGLLISSGSGAFVFDPRLGHLIGYGQLGKGAGGSQGTYWWTGSRWTALRPRLEPGAVDGVTMTYDALSGHVVLFGGVTASGAYLNKLWALKS